MRLQVALQCASYLLDCQVATVRFFCSHLLQVILMERAPPRSGGRRLKNLASISLQVPAHALLNVERPRPAVLHFCIKYFFPPCSLCPLW
jgi:hypothetical protein